MGYIKYLLILLLFCVFTSLVKAENDINKLLQELDKAVANKDFFIQQKQAEIDALKHRLEMANFTADQYLANKSLYNAYQKFDSDSAIVYASKCLEYGKKDNRKDWILESELNIIRIFSLRSFQPFVNEALEDFEQDSLPYQLELDYMTTLFDNQIRLKDLAKDTPYEQNCIDAGTALWNKYKDAIPEDYWAYTFYEISFVLDPNLDIEDKIREQIDKTRPNSEHRALLEFCLAIQLQRKGNKEGYIEHLILSAISDISSANRDAQSIVLIVDMLQHDHSHIDRVFNYSLLTQENARIYKDYGRSMEINRLQSFIEKIYKAKIDKQQRFTHMILAILAVSLIIIISLFILLKHKHNQQTEHIRKANERHKQLKIRFKKIKEFTRSLKKSNVLLEDKIKELDTNFINNFYLYSECIQNYKNFRKKTEILLKNGMVNDASRLAISIKFDNELQKLYSQFDKAFLAIHPDFINKFNKLLVEEGQIVVRKEGTLTPELRIYALVYLGITNSSKVAEFLHYSPQTVYNYRLKIRNLSILQEEKFENMIRRLYTNDTSEPIDDTEDDPLDTMNTEHQNKEHKD